MAVPKLRFTGFDGDYLELSYDKFAPLQRGFDLPVSTIVEGDYPVVFSNGILKKHNEFKAQAPGVVTGRSGTIGNITWVEKDYWPHNTSLWVTNFFDNEPKYVFYFLQKFDVSRFASGSGVPTLNRNDVHAQLITISPERREQTKIASFLSAVDEKISQLTQKHELLSQYKQGMMQKLFSQQIRFKADDGREFGEWEEKLLSEIGSFKNGLNKDKESFGFGSPFINLMDVFGKKVVQIDNLGLVEANQKDLENYDLKKGDVLFIRSSVKAEGVGQTALVIDDLPNTVYSGFLIRFRDNYGLDLGFKKYCFMNNDFRLRLLAKSTTSANTNINQESLSALTLNIPCLEEQSKIANFLSAIDQKIEVVAQQIEQAKQWKKGLLQQMFV